MLFTALSRALICSAVTAGTVTLSAQTADDPQPVRWEVDANAATGTNTQTDSKTNPDVLFKLDWQVRSPWSITAGGPTSNVFIRDAVSHVIFKTGFTQSTVGDKIQPNAAGATPSSSAPPCPGFTSTSSTPPPASCMTLTARQAFIVDVGGNAGFTVGANDTGTLAEFGVGYRGSLQKLFSSDQLVSKAGFSYVDLSRDNLRDAVGLYEVVGRFKLGAWGHDTNNSVVRAGKDVHPKNVEDFLVIEVGYQNNSALQHLKVDQPQVNTRNRLVGRFYAYPEIDKTTHTKALVGMEYNGGINGGPREIKLFYGVNLSVDKLFKR